MKKIIPCIIAGILLAITAYSQAITSKITSVSNVTCAQDSNGSAAVSANGGSPPYTYLWEPSGQTTDTAVGLFAVIQYTVTITDSTFDTAYNYVTLTATSNLGLSTSSSEVSCFGMADGTATALPTGGTLPYQYLWQPITTTSSTASNLSAGTYTNTVTDALGCTVTAPASVTQPAVLFATGVAAAGAIYASATGGTLPYTYSWSPPVSTKSIATGLAPGTYTIIVNDSNFCTSSVVVTVDTAIVTFSLIHTETDCRAGVGEFKIMASSNPPSYFNSGVLNIEYSGTRYLGDTVMMNATVGNIVVQQYIATFFPLTNTNLSDSVMQIVMSDTSYTPSDEILLDSVPKQILTVDFQIQNPCEPEAVGFTNELYTGPTCYYTLFAKVLDSTDAATQTTDSLYNPHTCQALVNPYPCNPVLYWNNITSSYDTSYSICYDTIYYTCYDTALVYTQTIDSFFTTYSKNLPYNTEIYSSSVITDTTICPPYISGYNSPMKAGIGDILSIYGSNFGSTRGTGQVEFKDADNPNYYIGLLNNKDYISWNTTQIQIRLPAIVDSFPSDSSSPVALGGSNFKVVNSCGDSAISSDLPPDTSHFSVYYNINQSWNYSANQKNEVLLRNMDNNGGYTLHLNPISFPTASIQRLIFIKAMRDWTCYTGMNWRIGRDTIIPYNVNIYPPPRTGTNYIFFTDSLTDPTIVASTPLAFSSGCHDSTVVLKEGDMYFNSDTAIVHFVYDTTGFDSIPTGYFDFYGVCLHELGHFMQLNHTSPDPSLLMYWTDNKGPISPANRILLSNGKAKSAVDGAIYSVNQSANTPTDCNGYLPLIPLSENCSNTTAIQKVEENNTFVIFPNPSQGTFTIKSLVNVYTLVVMNTVGQIILTCKIENQEAEIDISTVANGMYFVQEQYKNGIATQKLVITKK